MGASSGREMGRADLTKLLPARRADSEHLFFRPFDVALGTLFWGPGLGSRAWDPGLGPGLGPKLIGPHIALSYVRGHPQAKDISASLNKMMTLLHSEVGSQPEDITLGISPTGPCIK